MSAQAKADTYRATLARIESLIEGETDEIAVMATVVCELHHAFDYYHWTGFYRVTEPGILKIGPYQGGHGCLTIPFTRGVCGAAATQRRTQVIPDVTQAADHIACSSTTRSEIVTPLLDERGEVIAVLDVDSDEPAAFDDTDRRWLERIAVVVAERLTRRGTRDEGWESRV